MHEEHGIMLQASEPRTPNFQKKQFERKAPYNLPVDSDALERQQKEEMCGKTSRQRFS
jgi:hypothetical protein